MKKVLIALVVIVVGFVGFVASRPDTFTVQRKTTVNAPPEVVYGVVNDFHHFGDWSPWASMDPSMKTTYAGPESGKGASYAWVGNDKVGEGKMTITDSTPQKVTVALEFIKPFAASDEVVWAITPNGANTDFSWTMNGKSNFIFKAFGVFKDMDKMVGDDFQRGLDKLKTVAEAEAKKKADESAKAAAAAAQPAAPDAVPEAKPAEAPAK
ncbi:MAG: SRPBCC family protein [Myxococcaceae bacterium]